MVKMIRFRLGRALLHTGLRVLPPGRCQSELYQMMDTWTTKVNRVVEGAEGPV